MPTDIDAVMPHTTRETALRAYAALEWLRLSGAPGPTPEDAAHFSPRDDAAIRDRLATYAADYWD